MSAHLPHTRAHEHHRTPLVWNSLANYYWKRHYPYILSLYISKIVGKKHTKLKVVDLSLFSAYFWSKACTRNSLYDQVSQAMEQETETGRNKRIERDLCCSNS